LSPFVDPYGKDHRCYAEIKITNMADTSGKWTYKYTFNVNGKNFPVEEQEVEIQSGTSYIYEFTSDICKSGDTVKGEYTLVKGPTTPECNYEEVFEDKTVTKTVVEKSEVEKERKVPKKEPLWQFLLGLNKGEKV
jgi:hypothetical protein